MVLKQQTGADAIEVPTLLLLQYFRKRTVIEDLKSTINFFLFALSQIGWH
jgi:hypothetical protein